MNIEKYQFPIDPDGQGEEIIPSVELPPIPNTPEEILGVDTKASETEIRDAYYERSKLYHPSRNNNSEESAAWMRALTNARKELLEKEVALAAEPSVPSRAEIKKRYASQDPKDIVRKRAERNSPPPIYRQPSL